MSEMGKASVNGYGQTGNNKFDEMIDEDDPLMQDNPYRAPPEDEVFHFKDKEKKRKAMDRERNKKLKIWEKNRPAREGCLRKLCEKDIETADLAINPKVAD